MERLHEDSYLTSTSAGNRDNEYPFEQEDADDAG